MLRDRNVQPLEQCAENDELHLRATTNRRVSGVLNESFFPLTAGVPAQSQPWLRPQPMPSRKTQNEDRNDEHGSIGGTLGGKWCGTRTSNFSTFLSFMHYHNIADGMCIASLILTSNVTRSCLVCLFSKFFNKLCPIQRCAHVGIPISLISFIMYKSRVSIEL